MTEEQIKEFRELANRQDDDETSIGEDGDYFVGTLSMHDVIIWDYLKRHFKRSDYADYC